jgi:hypothetical protein
VVFAWLRPAGNGHGDVSAAFENQQGRRPEGLASSHDAVHVALGHADSSTERAASIARSTNGSVPTNVTVIQVMYTARRICDPR